MIRTIEVENFKGVAEPVTIEIRPITVVFGPNSAGKSTLLHALHYAREILERSNTNADRTSAGGDFLDLGGFQNFVHMHDRTRKVRLRFDLDLSGYDLTEAFAVPEAVLGGDDGNTLDLSTIGDDVFSGWVELVIRWSDAPTRRGAYVEQLSVGLDDHPVACIRTEERWDDTTRVTDLNLRHPVFQWPGTGGGPDDGPGATEARTILHYLYPSVDVLMNEYAEGAPLNLGTSAPPDAWTFRVDDPELFEPKSLRQSTRRTREGREYAVVLGQLLQGGVTREQSFLFPRDVWSESQAQELFELIRPDPAPLSVLIPGLRHAMPRLDEPLTLRYVELHSMDVEVPEDRTDNDDGPGPGGSRSSAERFEWFTAILTRVLLGPVRALRDELRQFRYLGPLRDTIPRNYEPARFPEDARWAHGWGAWDALYQHWEDLGIAVSDWLSAADKLDTGYRLSMKQYLELSIESNLWASLVSTRGLEDLDLEKERADLGPLKQRINVINTQSKVQLQPQDLGVGISEVLPVVVAALHPAGPARKGGGLVGVEQPELHLHPKQQAALADLLIEAALSTPLNTLIVETHSEHLILRLLRRVRDTTRGNPARNIPVSTDDVRIWYVHQEDGSSRQIEMPFSDQGEFLQPVPDTFFDQDYQERFG